MTEIPSPCRNICEIDPSGKHCTGCGRTLDEIAAWPHASEAVRLAIMAKLHERKVRSAP
jgi:predicted Fe-S protein YdhL (DUF1289 family)